MRAVTTTAVVLLVAVGGGLGVAIAEDTVGPLAAPAHHLVAVRPQTASRVATRPRGAGPSGARALLADFLADLASRNDSAARRLATPSYAGLLGLSGLVASGASGVTVGTPVAAGAPEALAGSDYRVGAEVPCSFLTSDGPGPRRRVECVALVVRDPRTGRWLVASVSVR